MKKLLFWAIAVLIGFAAYFMFNVKTFYTIIEVYDGDTIAVDMAGTTEKVRLIGIDTPETVDPRKPVQCFGPESSTYTHILLKGKKVRLVADPLSTNRDRYDRLLRYAYLADGTFYNAHLIQEGYARAYVGFPFTKSNSFMDLQQKAAQTKKGLWSHCATEATLDAQISVQ